MHLLAGLLALSGDLAALAAHQLPTEPTRTTLAGQLELSRLVDLASIALEIPIEYDTAALRSHQVTLRSTAGLTNAELWSLTNRSLLQRNLTTVRPPDHDGLVVVPVEQALRAARAERFGTVAQTDAALGIDSNPQAGAAGAAGTDDAERVSAQRARRAWAPGFRVLVVELEHIEAAEAADAVRAVLQRGQSGGSSTGGSAGAHAGTGTVSIVMGPRPTILLGDAQPRLREALHVLRQLDAPDAATVIEEVPLTHLTPSAMISLLDQVGVGTSRRAMPRPTPTLAHALGGPTAIAISDLASGAVGAASGDTARPPAGAASAATDGGGPLSGRVIPAAGPSSVLVIAPRRSVAAWRRIIAQLDQREAAETIAYSPRVFSVQEVAALIEQADEIARRDSRAAADRVRVVVEAPTGTLLVSGTPDQHAKVRALLDRLDNLPAEARRPIRVFPIRNRPVDELLGVLDRMLAAGVLEGSRGAGPRGADDEPAAGTAPAAPLDVRATLLPEGSVPLSVRSADGVNTGGGSATSRGSARQTSLTGDGSSPEFGDGGSGRGTRTSIGAASDSASGAGLAARPSLPITLTADQSTNTLIAVGETRLLDQLAALLPTLDRAQPQVMLEVVLVSLSDSDAVSFGVELERLRIDGDVSSRLASLFGLASPASVGGGASRSPLGTGVRVPPDGLGFTGAVINPGEFSIIVRALQSLRQGRAVSLPKVLVANNQRAQFNSVRQEPFGASFTAGNASSPTTSFGGSQDAGTQLSIKPQIGEGDSLMLSYDISLSAFVGSATSANLPPPRQVNSVQSLATIPDGHTIVVGGLEATTEGQDVTQIPVIGDIPLIGELFKNRSLTRSRTRFFVFIRANVVRGTMAEGLRHLSRSDAAAAGLDTQLDWPATLPRIIAPGGTSPILPAGASNARMGPSEGTVNPPAAPDAAGAVAPLNNGAPR